MMKVGAVVLLSSLGAMASAWAGPGFFNPSAANAPAQVQKAADAVYRYVIRTEAPSHVFQKSEYEASLAKYAKGEFLDQLIAAELKDCQSKDQAECPTHYMATGTAFVVGEKHDQLITVAHNLQYNRKEYEDALGTPAGQDIAIHVGEDEQGYVRNMPLNFDLYDHNGKKVFDTRIKGDYARPIVMGFGEMVNWRKDFFSETPVDFVSIQLSRPVGNLSLELSNATSKPGEEITVLGFPRRTVSRDVFDHQPDSDGFAQFYSTGAVQDPEAVFQFMIGPSYTKSMMANEAAANYLIYNDSESVMGFSGSPVLDSQGKVVGVLDAAWGVTDDGMYMVHNAIILQMRWIQENLKKYAP